MSVFHSGCFRQHCINKGVHVWHIPSCLVASECMAADRSVAEGLTTNQSSRSEKQRQSKELESGGRGSLSMSTQIYFTFKMHHFCHTVGPQYSSVVELLKPKRLETLLSISTVCIGSKGSLYHLVAKAKNTITTVSLINYFNCDSLTLSNLSHHS